MNFDFLKNLGLADKEIIDQILAENSRDLAKAGETADELKNSLRDLAKQNGDYAAEIAGLKKMHAIENGLREAKARNIKAVMALLDMDKISFNDDKLDGLAGQIENLTKGEDTSFLFGESKTPALSGLKPNDPPSGGKREKNPPLGRSFSEAVAAALGRGKN